jgi:hypothetical protein
MARNLWQFSDPLYDKVAFEIGRITIEWARVEMMLNDFIVETAYLVVKIKRKSPKRRESYQSLAPLAEGSKRLILSTR